MTAGPLDLLCDPVLNNLGIVHGFGQKGSQVPDYTFFSEQVHGIDVFDVGLPGASQKRPKADILLCRDPAMAVGIVTADCLPILLASSDGDIVAAIHAGWRGLAAGVIEAGLKAMGADSGTANPVVAAVGPAAGGCCYEVDGPVRAGLERRYSGLLKGPLVAGRPGHFQLDLTALAVEILVRNGIARHRIGTENAVCTVCSGPRFESYRRDGARAGRLSHFIVHPGVAHSRVDSL
ncbi:MAG: polyphenol oxidase family protein [Myxococcota bacterium]